MNPRLHSFLLCIVAISTSAYASIDQQVRTQALDDARAGRWTAAEPTLVLLSQETPADATACAELARYRLVQGRGQEAAALLKLAVKADPSNVDYRLMLAGAIGSYIGTLQSFDQADPAQLMLQCYDKALELSPENADALAGLVVYHLMAPAEGGGSLDTARAYADRLLKRDATRGTLALAIIEERAGHADRASTLYREAFTKLIPETRAAGGNPGFLEALARQSRLAAPWSDKAPSA